MRFIDIIEKKKNNEVLSQEEISFWIKGVVKETIPEYQTAALLMAIVLNGMTPQETADLTEAMLHSGNVFDLSAIKGIKVDKHSTGGVGDKTTLVVAPLVAACGAYVAKMSGRGLGHTGGTLDKLESISGFNIELDENRFIKQVNQIGLALIGQTSQTVPADKKLYALRDVTATVSSIPLIASSIMSKKLASGADTILLDVKYGDGAFMSTKEDAEILANTMIDIGNRLNRNVKAIITNMNQHLGFAVGNALEVKEAVMTLLGQGPQDFTILCLNCAEIMLIQAKIATDHNHAKRLIQEAIKSKAAFNKFCEMVAAQGGDVNQIHNLELLPQAKYITEMVAPQDGYIGKIYAHQLGECAMLLGAGRSVATDKINHAVGLVGIKKVNDFVKKDDVICYVHHDQQLDEHWIQRFYQCYVFSKEKVVEDPLIYKII